MNRIEIAGHLGADPEERFTNNGTRVIELRVATRARKDETIWWRVTIWDEVAKRHERMLPHFKKGSAIIVYGAVRPPKAYLSNKDGSAQVTLGIDAETLCFSPFGRSDKGEQGGMQQSSSFSQQQKTQPAQEQFASYGVGQESAQPENAFAGDDLPF